MSGNRPEANFELGCRGGQSAKQAQESPRRTVASSSGGRSEPEALGNSSVENPTSQLPRGGFAPQILVAMPSLQDGYFDKSVILLCEYTEAGAMGFVINSPSATTVDDLLKELGLETDDRQKQHILIGGPVQPELCWVVHTEEFKGDSTARLGEKMAISAAQEVLTAIAEGVVPQEYILGVGYAGWGPGQLDREIEADAWWLADMDLASILEHTHENRWEMVMGHLGLDTRATAYFKA